MLFALAFQAEQERDQIAGKLSCLAGITADLEDKIGRPRPSLNSLDELHGTPGEVEAAVGAFNTASRLLRKFLEIYPAQAG